MDTVIKTESNNIRNYLVQAAHDITEHSGKDFNSATEWVRIRPERYSELIEMLSLQDMPMDGERPPLNVNITGTIQRDGYRIEKLWYESLPGLYVPANLYIPDNIKEPVPALIYVCGHSHTQKVHYQTHPAKFAQLGFICLIVETIQYGEVRGEHWGCYARGWFNWYSRGYTPAGVEVWNAIRGLDLLAERPEVDQEKMGVTGISGGGAISWFLGAADPRIKAVAPVCGASTLGAQITTRTIDGHCDCMMYINTFQRDFRDIGALIAPRPILIGQSDRDGLNRVESVREIYTDLKRIYDLHGVPGNISYIETPGGHSYHEKSRSGIFSFFLEHLMGKSVSPEEAGDIDQSPGTLLSEQELQVYVDGPPPGDRTTTIQDSFVSLAVDPEISSDNELNAFREKVTDFLRTRSFGAFPDNPPSFDSVRVFRTLDRASHGSDIYSFVSEEGWRLKADLRWRNDPAERKPLMIVLRNSNEKRYASEEFISGLDNTWNIAYLEVRGVGEYGWDSNLQWHVRRASAWTGRTLASMQVYDLLRCIEFCRTLPGVDAESIGLAARDDMGVVALYAALLDGKCKTLILKNPPESQNVGSSPDGRGAAVEILNCLRITDVYQLPALLAPAEIIFIGEMPGSYKWSEYLLNKLGIKSITRIDDL
ncbi:MAG: alpha/beta hydrolase family protein [Bacteroidales bacterium]|nr:alpha/beta hydrolase family protein [Bacteroidales bacterium]